ncbi:MAG: outer membrane lipoprotein carrier protein [Pseudohongiellaceae bacterium]|jgi:outer membrane lipoprotein carrier protein
MNKTLNVITLASACFTGLSSQALAADSERLESLLSHVTTLTADVTQLIVESSGGVLEESSIKMKLKKPDGFYWETTDPFPELIVTDGVKLWNYQPDLEQVVVEDWQSDQSELAAQLLSGRTDSLNQEYTISLAQIDAGAENFTLTPIASDSVYASIAIQFIETQLDAIYINSKNGEQTVWQFFDVKTNVPLSDSEFHFEPPAGIEVIENNYSQ